MRSLIEVLSLPRDGSIVAVIGDAATPAMTEPGPCHYP
jgi:hypothetical protein